ncbi:MAG: hypothetical protein ACK5Z5_03395 [Neisseriaceae bacterium]
MEELLLPERLILQLIDYEEGQLKSKLEKIAGIKVYKYQNNNDYLSSVIDGEIYFSSPVNFNDILDCNLELSEEKINRSNIKKPLSEIIRRFHYGYYKNESDQDKYNYDWEDIVYEIKHRNKIFCLTEHSPLSFKSHQMWGLYAGTGTGFVAEYDLKDLLYSLMTDIHAYNSNLLEIDEFGVVNKNEYFIEVQ